MIELFLANQFYVIFLLCIMIIGGIAKDYDIFNNLFIVIHNKIKSKRLILFLTSIISGILPVPGRVTVSAGILDSIAPKDSEKRQKYGIIDFLSTHHYYLWSPLEKTIILPMAVLGLTYLHVIYLLLPLIILSFIFIGIYLYRIDENDIEINIKDEKVNYFSLLNILPFIIGVILIGFAFNAAIVFGIITLYYILFYKVSFKKILSYINWKLLTIVFFIILTGNIVHTYTSVISAFLSKMAFSMHTFIGFISISAIAFMSSFVLGSSSRFSGIVSLLSLTFGVQYFIYFFALDFAAYLLSPTHKCVMIGKMYFGTKLSTYYKAILIWSILLITAALIVIFL